MPVDYRLHASIRRALFKVVDLVKNNDPLFTDASTAVLDIDDTVLKSETPPEQCQIVCESVRDLYRALVDKRWHIFFVTARLDSAAARAWTRSQLLRAGFAHWTGLFLMPPDAIDSQQPHNFSLYKTEVRAALQQNGYRIGLNVGDSWNDLLLVPPWSYKDPRDQQAQSFVIATLFQEPGPILMTGLPLAALSVKLPSVESRLADASQRARLAETGQVRLLLVSDVSLGFYFDNVSGLEKLLREQPDGAYCLVLHDVPVDLSGSVATTRFAALCGAVEPSFVWQTLVDRLENDFGLGRLDDQGASVVYKHLHLRPTDEPPLLLAPR